MCLAAGKQLTNYPPPQKQEKRDLRPSIDGIQQIVLCRCHSQAFHAVQRAVVPSAVMMGSIGAGQVLSNKSQSLCWAADTDENPRTPLKMKVSSCLLYFCFPDSVPTSRIRNWRTCVFSQESSPCQTRNDRPSAHHVFPCPFCSSSGRGSALLYTLQSKRKAVRLHHEVGLIP